MRVRPEDLVLDLVLEAGHQRQDHHERGHADDDPENRDQGNDVDDGLLALSQQVTSGDEHRVGHGKGSPT